MFRTIRFAALVSAASLIASPALAQSSPVVGKWATAVETDFGKFEAVMTVAQQGGAYTIAIQDIAPRGSRGRAASTARGSSPGRGRGGPRCP